METAILRYNIGNLLAINMLNLLKDAGIFEVYKNDDDFIQKFINGENQLETKQLEIKNVKGALKQYANPALIEKEKYAWAINVKEKYADI